MKLLLLLCLLSPAFGPVSAQDKRPVHVVTVEEGADALLPCALNFSVDKFDWKKDSGGEEKEVFFYDKGSYYGHKRSDQDQSQQFRGRVEFFKERLEFGNASITIKNTRLEDNGTYTCVLFKPERHKVDIDLNVGAAPLPHIQTLDDGITWRFLSCLTKGVPEPEVQWRNSAGQVLAKHVPNNTDGHSHVELQLNVTRSDTYICVVTQWDIHHQINNSIKVRFSENFPVWQIIAAGLAFALIVAIAVIAWCAVRNKKPKMNASSTQPPEKVPSTSLLSQQSA